MNADALIANAEAIAHYYATRRAVGHSMVQIQGYAGEDALIVGYAHAHARSFASHLKNHKEDDQRALSLGSNLRERLSGLERRPLVVEHYALQELLTGLLEIINQQAADLKKLGNKEQEKP